MTESNVDESGAGGTPTPPVSKSPVADDDEKLSKLVRSVVEDVVKPIKSEISSLYSRQDKDRNAFGEFMAEFKKQKGKGLDDEAAELAANNAMQERSEREQEKAWRQQVSEKLGLVSGQPAGSGATGTVDATAILKQVGLDETTPEAIEFLRGQYQDPDRAELAARRLKDRQASRPQPTPETSASVKGNPPPSDKITEAAADTLYDQLRTLRRSPSLNRAQISKIEKQLADGGYPL